MTALGTALVVASLALTAEARAQLSLNRAGSGARAAGMGNAFIAISDDGTAASWNPAGLSQLRRPEFSLVHADSRRTEFLEGYRTLDRLSAFTTLETTNTADNIEFASAALPFTVKRRPVTLQLGWRRLYQFSSRMQGETRRVPIGPNARPLGSIRFDNASDGSVNIWTLAGAARLTSRLSLGVSADFYRGAWGDRFNVSEEPGVDSTTDFLSAKTRNSISDHTATVGLLLVYPSVKLGVVYHQALASPLATSEWARSNLAPSASTSLTDADGVQLHFPRSVGFGVAWIPRPLLRLALDLTYDEWKKFLVERGPGILVSGFDELPPELTATRNTVTINAGLERLFQVQGQFVPLRLGFSHEPQGARDPLVREDAAQTVLAAGTGINSNSLKFDVSLEYRWGSFHNTQNISPVYMVGRAEEHGLPLSPEAQGVFRITEWRLKVSMIFRLADAEKIRDVVKKAIGP